MEVLLCAEETNDETLNEPKQKVMAKNWVIPLKCEYKVVVKKVKSKRAPGTDNIPAELIKQEEMN